VDRIKDCVLTEARLGTRKILIQNFLDKRCSFLFIHELEETFFKELGHLSGYLAGLAHNQVVKEFETEIGHAGTDLPDVTAYVLDLTRACNVVDQFG